MKKFIIIFLACITLSYTLNAQAYLMSDIYTPNCSPVTTWWISVDDPLPVKQARDADLVRRYPNANLIVTHYENNVPLSSTQKFNCHGYAWLRVEQGIDRWIGLQVTTEEDIYMLDGSYLPGLATYPNKVSWASGDHSAVTTAQSGVLISKWADGPLMEHAWNYSPYGSNNLKYYVKAPTGLSGPYKDEVCYSGGSFNLVNPSSCTVQWSLSGGPFTISPSTTNWVTVTKTYAAVTGSGILTAKINGSVVATKTIKACPSEIEGPSTVFYGASVYYYVQQLPGATYKWTHDGILTMTSSNNSSGVTFYVPYVGYDTERIRCTITINGVSGYLDKYVYVCP